MRKREGESGWLYGKGPTASHTACSWRLELVGLFKVWMVCKKFLQSCRYSVYVGSMLRYVCKHSHLWTGLNMSLEPSGHVCRSKTAFHVGATLALPPQLRTMWGQGSHCPHNYVQCGDEAPTAPTTTYNVGARLPLPPHFYTCNYEFFFHARSRIDATAG